MNLNIIDYAINHSRVFFGILVFIIAAGSSTYVSIPKEATPDVNIPIIYPFLKKAYQLMTQKDYLLSQLKMKSKLLKV